MKKTMLLPDCFLVPFLRNYECPVCGQRDRTVTLRYPRVRRVPPHIELGFPVRCPCGKADHLKIIMPMLLFGYLLAWDALVGSERKFAKSEMSLRLGRSGSDLLQQLIPEYEALLAQTVQRANQLVLPSENVAESDSAKATERLGFGFNEQQWADFLRRLGIDESTPEGPSNE